MEENDIIETIVFTYDWEEVLNQIIVVEGMDPLNIDVGLLTDKFIEYLEKMRDFDLRIPARFILVAALLIKLKAEILLEEERKRREKEVKIPDITIKDLPPLQPPIERLPTRKVSLPELIAALNNAMRFQEKKVRRKERMKKKVEGLFKVEEETIEDKIARFLNQIIDEGGNVKFSELIVEGTRKEFADKFLSLLYLVFRGKITANQEEMFGEIFIKLIDNSQKESEVDAYGNEITRSRA